MDRLSFKGSLQLAWDSTSLRVAEECWRKYYYSIVLARAPAGQNVHLTFGLQYHAALEHYAQLRALGYTYDQAVRRTVLRAMISSHGWKSDDPYKNRLTLIRSIVWYLDKWRNDPLETVIGSGGIPAVELSFRFQLPIELDKEPALYCGHLDRLATLNGKVYVADHKTTKSALAYNYFDRFSPDVQMSGYTAGAKITFHQPVVGVIIDAAQIGVGFTRFQRGFTLRSQDQLDEWIDNTCYHISLAVNYSKLNFWPMNRSSCDKWGGCEFRPVCSRPQGQRESWLKGDFATRVWDPLKTRGDI